MFKFADVVVFSRILDFSQRSQRNEFYMDCCQDFLKKIVTTSHKRQQGHLPYSACQTFNTLILPCTPVLFPSLTAMLFSADEMRKTREVVTGTVNLRGEWPSGLNSLRQVTEVKLGRVRSELWMGDLGGLTSQLTSSSFGRDVKLGVPCLHAACTVGLN